jgi:hypothetical protein
MQQHITLIHSEINCFHEALTKVKVSVLWQGFSVITKSTIETYVKFKYKYIVIFFFYFTIYSIKKTILLLGLKLKKNQYL